MVDGVSSVVATVAGAIEAYRALVRLPDVAFEGVVERAGTEVVVRGPGGDARGPVSASFLLAARASARLADVHAPTLRFHDAVLSQRTSGPVYEPIVQGLVDLAMDLRAEDGHGDEPLFLLRQATLGVSLHLPLHAGREAVLATAPRTLVERALERRIEVPETTTCSALAKKAAPFAGHDEPLVRHECGLLLASAVGAITNTSAAGLAKTILPALTALWTPGPALVEEQATLAAELFAYRLALEAESWRVSQKTRDAAVSALHPLARELAARNVERREQARRLALDGTPLAPPPGTEDGPWKKEVREARAVREARGLSSR